MYRKKTLIAAALILLLAACFSSSQAHNVTLSQYMYDQGAKINLHVKGEECVNVPNNWKIRASGINTHGQCFLLFGFNNCGGEYFKCENCQQVAGIDFGNYKTTTKMCQYKDWFTKARRRIGTVFSSLRLCNNTVL